MSILEEKSRDIGRLIGQSAEYQAVKRANDALSNDREVTALLRELETLRRQVLERGDEPTPEMEERLNTLLEQLQSYPSYQSLVVAQENFDKLMMRVNEWILTGIRAGAASPIITLA